MFVFLLLLAMIAFSYYFKEREGMESQDPSVMVQQQQGELDHIKKQVDAVTLTRSAVDKLQDLSDTNDDNTGTLQSNMGQTNTTALPNAYPDES